MLRRDFLRRGSLWVLGATVLTPELVDRLTWRRRLFPGTIFRPNGPHVSLIGVNGEELGHWALTPKHVADGGGSLVVSMPTSISVRKGERLRYSGLLPSPHYFEPAQTYPLADQTLDLSRMTLTLN
jgi:hypothetical protein